MHFRLMASLLQTSVPNLVQHTITLPTVTERQNISATSFFTVNFFYCSLRVFYFCQNRQDYLSDPTLLDLQLLLHSHRRLQSCISGNCLHLVTTLIEIFKELLLITINKTSKYQPILLKGKKSNFFLFVYIEVRIPPSF